jgi:hypothetical protein
LVVDTVFGTIGLSRENRLARDCLVGVASHCGHDGTESRAGHVEAGPSVVNLPFDLELESKVAIFYVIPWTR